jgi:HEAT repeat protein
LDDDIEFVRVVAVRAARRQPLPHVLALLIERLGDSSWWVRKGAAETLAAMGPAGEEALFEAAESHPDRYARDMAAQVIVDSGIDRTPWTDVAA